MVQTPSRPARRPSTLTVKTTPKQNHPVNPPSEKPPREKNNYYKHQVKAITLQRVGSNSVMSSA